MRFIFALSVLAFAHSAWASPTADRTHIAKRATTTDTATTGYASGTTGGTGGATITVATLDALTSAVASDTAKIVILSGTLTGDAVVNIGSNTSLLGKSGASLIGIGLRVLSKSNVIVRNIKISKVLAGTGDAIGIQASSKVWVDHVDLSSDRDHDKDYYDGLLDITHGSFAITVSYSYLYNHWKASLVGHSDSNGAEDVAIRVTYHHNYWNNLNSRLPSFRFGQGHIYNNYYLASNDGINSRDGATLLVQNNVFESVSNCAYTTNVGYLILSGNLGCADVSGSPPNLPYPYTLQLASSVKASVVGVAGATLSF